MPDEDLDLELQQEAAIRLGMPNCWSAFFARFGRLRPVQRKSIPEILAGKSVLVTAPTAGGKTEAVAAPICERMLRERWSGLSTVLVTPTRALVNDLFFRLEVPCQQAGIKLARKTSDHPLADEPGDHFLITTPESLESILTFRRQLLCGLRAVVIDEIHLLHGTPRGDQLRMILARLRHFLDFIRAEYPTPLQTVALSATITDPQSTAAAYLGDAASVVAIHGQRDLEARVLVAQGDDKGRAQAAIQESESFPDIRKILVFVNSRKQVDAGAEYFRHGSFLSAPVFGHHGNLSKIERETAESRFRNDPKAICVATMTLEVGIDIGDVDLVICMDPPFSLSSFLQRIGRGCRRLRGKTRVLCVARDRARELLFGGLIAQARQGLPRGPRIPYRRSVLFQQVLAYLQQVDQHRRTATQFTKILTTMSAPTVDHTAVAGVLAGMVVDSVVAEQDGIFEPASLGWNFIQSHRIYSNIDPTPAEITLVDVETGKPVVSVAGVVSHSGGLRVAGRSYDVLPGDGFTRRVRAAGEHASPPQYHARKLPYAHDVGVGTARYLRLPENRLAVLQLGDRVIVMTWLGRLLNTCLAQAGKCDGQDVLASSFALHLKGRTAQDAEDALRRMAERIQAMNPLGDIAVERIADLGPYFRRLSPDVQVEARKDWLDQDFVRQWMAGIDGLDVIPLETPLGADLLALADE